MNHLGCATLIHFRPNESPGRKYCLAFSDDVQAAKNRLIHIMDQAQAGQAQDVLPEVLHCALYRADATDDGLAVFLSELPSQP